MHSHLRSAASVLAVAAILAYLGLISLSDIGGYVPWRADMLVLSIGAVVSGTVLALAEKRAILLQAIASLLSALLFGAFWTYATWGLLGGFVPLLELLLSDFVLLYTLQRGFLLVGTRYRVWTVGRYHRTFTLAETSAQLDRMSHPTSRSDFRGERPWP